MTEEQKEDIKLLKELIADTSIPNDDREIYQEALNQILAQTKSDMPKEAKEKMPKKEKATPKAKASKKPKAEKPTALPSDVDAMKKAIKERTGKTEAECEDIIAQYRMLRNKAKVNGAKRIAKLKSSDDLITGTNVITPVAQIEKDAEIVKAKIEKQVEQIENKAEREVVKKDKTKDEVKVEVEQKVVKQLAKLSDEMVLSATTFVKNIQTELKKVDKTEAKNFLLGLRNEIDALLSKFGDGGGISKFNNGGEVKEKIVKKFAGYYEDYRGEHVVSLVKEEDGSGYYFLDTTNGFTGGFFKEKSRTKDALERYVRKNYMVVSKFGDGGTTEIYNITEMNSSSSSVNPSKFAMGGSVYAIFDNIYILKVYDLNDNLVDSSKKIVARNLLEAKEIAIDDYETAMHKKYGRDLRFKIELAPSMMAKGGGVDKFNIAYIDATGIYMGKPYDKYKLVTNILKKHNIEVNNSKEWGTKGYAEELYEDIDGESYYTIKLNINDSDNPELLKKQIENLPRQINWQFTTDDEYKKGGVTGKDNRAKKVIRNVNGFDREFPIGDAWRKEHNEYNESEKYEISKSSRKS